MKRPSIKNFQKTVHDYYRQHARILPWRKAINPYRILVSEIMLQQTQVSRVKEKFSSFIKNFPDFKSLDRAPLADVLKAWQGLGYNRRAIALKKIARVLVHEYGGRLPDDVEILQTLPGIGYATACSVAAFAFNAPTIFIETNIRTVFIHHFFRTAKKVHDKEILLLVEKTLDRSHPRDWYYALMDYGTYLKKQHGNKNIKSFHYSKQSRFEGSNRQLRGKIIKILLKHKRVSRTIFAKELGAHNTEAIAKNLAALKKEGFPYL